MNNKVKGYVLGAVAAATYGMNPLFALPLYKHDMDPDSVLFFRYLFAIVMLGLMIKLRGRSFRLQRREILPLVVLGLLVAVSSLTLFQSYNYMAAGIASTLLFVYPVMVAVIMALVFKEKITLLTGLCIVLALLGIGLLYRGEDGATLSWIGTLLVMISALAYAIYIVGVNRPRLKSVATLTVTFYVILFGLSLFLVRLNFGRDVSLPDEWYMWGKSYSIGYVPNGHIVPVYYGSHPVYRFDSDGHTRCSRACYGGDIRCDYFRRASYAENYMRYIDDNSCRYIHNRRWKHYELYGTFPQAVPEAADAASQGEGIDIKNTIYTQKAELS